MLHSQIDSSWPPADQEARTALHHECFQLYRERDYLALGKLLEKQPESVLFESPELGFLLVTARSRTGKTVDSKLLADALLARTSSRGNTTLNRRLRNAQAVAQLELGKIQAAEILWLRLAEDAAAANDLCIVARANANIAVIADILCYWSRSLAASNRALAEFFRLGDARAIANVHNNLSITYRQTGSVAASLKHADLALELGAEHSSGDDVGMFRLTRARIAVQEGKYDFASSLAAQSYADFVRLQNRTRQGEAALVLGIAKMAQGRHQEAEVLLLQALVCAVETKSLLLQAEVHRELAHFNRSRRRSHSAEMEAQRAVAIYRRLGAVARAQRLVADLQTS